MKKLFICLFFLLIIGNNSAFSALQVIDDFEDGDITAWTEVHGDSIWELDGYMHTTLATMNGQSSKSIGADVYGGDTWNTYVGHMGLVLNYNSIDDFFVFVIQDNNGNGLFDRVYFYKNYEAYSATPAVTETYFENLSFEVPNTYFEVTDNGDGTVTGYIEATGDTWTKTFDSSYTGTGIGLKTYYTKADNFYADSVPVPGAIWLLGSGLIGLVGYRRKLNK